jgi:hypothetical protein
MQIVLRYLSGFAGVFFVVLGLTFLLAPGSEFERFALLPSGNAGLSTLRGDMGGLFLGMGCSRFSARSAEPHDFSPSLPRFSASSFSEGCSI